MNAGRTQRLAWVLQTFDVIPFDTACAQTYGALCAVVRAAGRDPRPRRFDLLIAAVAHQHALPLLTRNPRDFTGIHPSLDVRAV